MTCKKCGKPFYEHRYCNCLVSGCCGYKINERCSLKDKYEKMMDEMRFNELE